MTTMSPAKLAANRRNAHRSTGPRTPRGKSTSALNARRHGLLARDPVVPGEKAKDYAALRDHLHADLAPVGEVEQLLVERVASLSWRLARLTEVEAMFYAKEADSATNEADYTGVFRHYSDDMSKFSRYEALLERGLFKALHELERRQAGRSGVQVPPPVAVDVALDVASVDVDGGAAEA
jgi:hypothetical protein